MKIQTTDSIVQRAIAQAETWQNRASELLTSRERITQKQFKSLLSNALDKVILAKMIDQCFRSKNARRVSDQLCYILAENGIPSFFSNFDKLLIRLFLAFGRQFPRLSVPRIVNKMRRDSARLIIPGESRKIRAFLKKRKHQDVHVNLNHLGEAVLGEEEALSRLEAYLNDLQNPEIELISIKISTIYSQIVNLAFEPTVMVLRDRLSELYRVARDHQFVRNDGTRIAKFVTLDMEEHGDMEVTYEAFTTTLDQEEFKGYSAGMALQAYIPDSFELQKKLTSWAKRRTQEGGAPIKLRIVKGANMEMERVESALSNWPLAPYDSKTDVDANYKCMVRFGMDPKNIKAVHLGIASHNLFDQAFAQEMARENGVTDYFITEMIEGMADHVSRAVREAAKQILLYAPVASKDEFVNAIAYLIRRLDENTGEENFLRYAPALTTDSEAWGFLRSQFLESVRRMEEVKHESRRVQNRNTESFPDALGTYHTGEFENEPDTDWSLAANRRWADGIRKKWKKRADETPFEVPLVIGDEEIFANREIKKIIDPSQINLGVCVAHCAIGKTSDVERAVSVAKSDRDRWRETSLLERHRVLSRVATQLRQSRGDLIGVATANTGKIFTEADVEVSEAIDFAEYYPYSARVFDDLEGVRSRGKGVGVVISPWNFPISIPAGGIIASLATGNTVIFKPSSDAILVGWQLCKCFWSAGVSKNALQFLPCAGAAEGRQLTDHPDVDYVILTGGTETGLRILKSRPAIFLAAETGGKNATIVTAMSDKNQVIKNVIYSAFGNCGQKCSATSLLILEREVYEDARFKKQLVDAAGSYPVGSAWEFQNRMGPLIHPPQRRSEKGIRAFRTRGILGTGTRER